MPRLDVHRKPAITAADLLDTIDQPHNSKKPPVMLPAELELHLQAIFGARRWQRAWCNGTGYSHSTLLGFLTGQIVIPQAVAVMIEMMTVLRMHGFPLPDAFSVKASRINAPSPKNSVN
jgi:hypothetical protein